MVKQTCIILSVFFIVSCSNIEYDNGLAAIMSANEKTALIKEYAQELSKAMTSKDLRCVIKDMALKQFDGDYDILLSDLHAETKSKASIDFETISDLFYDKISESIPNLQVSVPVHCEEWDSDSFLPLVVFLPYDFDEHKVSEVEAFDAHGNVTMLSIDEEPDFPVVVVSVSERIDTNGEEIYKEEIQPVTKSGEPGVPEDVYIMNSGSNMLEIEWKDVEGETGYIISRKTDQDLLYSPIASTPGNVNYYIDSNLEAGKRYSYRVNSINASGSSAYTRSISSFASDRCDGGMLKIKRMYFTKDGLRNVESWVSGAPEIRLRVVVGNENSAYAKYTSSLIEPKKRDDINGRWWEKELELFNWYTNQIGTVLTFDWREEDPASSESFSITSSYEDKYDSSTIKGGQTVNYTRNDGKDHMGTTLVLWWDAYDKIYDLGGFKWQFE